MFGMILMKSPTHLVPILKCNSWDVKIVLGNMNRTRLDRKNDFDEFYKSAIITFTEFRDSDKSAEKFQRVYMLCVCPGSRAGGQDNRVVEVFWGSRPFESITHGRSWTALTEYGATLLFHRDDSGYVIISLYPAGTDNRKPIESNITLHIWIDPKKLKDKVFLKKCWNYFMAYMEYTSLDGNPTLIERLKISYLRTFKHLTIDKTWRPIKFIDYIKDVVKFAFTVGLSGFIIYLLTIYSSQKNENKIKEQINNEQKKIIYIETKVDSIQNIQTGLNILSKKTDSLEATTKEVLRRVSRPGSYSEIVKT